MNGGNWEFILGKYHIEAGCLRRGASCSAKKLRKNAARGGR